MAFLASANSILFFKRLGLRFLRFASLKAEIPITSNSTFGFRYIQAVSRIYLGLSGGNMTDGSPETALSESLSLSGSTGHFSIPIAIAMGFPSVAPGEAHHDIETRKLS